MTPGGTISSPDARIAAIAARQHGVITLLQLLAAGLSRKAIQHRLKDGRLHRLHRGVYAVGHAGLSYEGRALAAVLACGDGAALSHLHAASLYGISRFRRPSLIDVVVSSKRRAHEGVRVRRRGVRREDVTVERGIRVTRPARIYVDLNDTLTSHQLANLMHQGAYRGLFSAAATRDAMARARRTKTVERALGLYESGTAGTRSNAEDAFLRLVAHDEPLVNTHLLGEEVDFHWPDRRLVVEIDGPGHGRPANRRHDAHRDAKLRRAGYTVIRFSDADVYSGARRLARQCTAEQLPQLIALLG